MEHGKYSIWIVSPPGYVHSRCFEEVAIGLRAAFAALGFDAPIVTTPERVEGAPIVLGANLLKTPGLRMPAHFIVYNLEQISPESAWLDQTYLTLLRNHRIWDYSVLNIGALAGLGIKAALCDIGYAPALTRIPPAPARDLDVVFVGSMNDRRRAVLQALVDRGKKVYAGFALYGAERDAMYARAKLILNVHFYEAKVLEIVRVSYLLANRLCVVSETGEDSALEASLRDGVAFAPYEKLVDTCLRLLGDDAERARLSQRGFELFAARDQAAMLKVALQSVADGR